MPTIPDPFSSSKLNNTSIAMTQLAADLLVIIAKGEKSVRLLVFKN
jgi:hypothetical protein